MGGSKENPKKPNIPKSPKCKLPMISKSKRPEISMSLNPEHAKNKAHKSNNPEISKPQEFKILKIRKTQTRRILQCPESQNTKSPNPQITKLRKPRNPKIAKSQDLKMPRNPKSKNRRAGVGPVGRLRGGGSVAIPWGCAPTPKTSSFFLG